ncbi:Cell death activator CIDE-A [Anabarilius grahami]|uniref:Cell death activator CIDE-A n=1 Tax=Anabarilius grahami TaxID=495550 RepID=A0A3N0XN09_ANAGA|nr:Cell death activator CIDE-A [Anabarilius grahami]
MEYAKTLVPTSLIRVSDLTQLNLTRSVSSMQTSLAQRMLPPPQPRPYKVCTQNRRRRKGFTATSLGDLMEQVLPSFRQSKRSGIAKLSFDLYKLSPKDFLGCLTIKATLYEIYTLSYDIKCTRAKYFLKSLLRCFMYVAKLTGQVLLCGSAYVLRYIGEEECCS